MNLLAIDQSSGVSSVALLRNGTLCEACDWPNERATNQHVFEAVPSLMRRHGTNLAAMDGFAVGLGPGSFSGLRISLSAAQAFALPGGTPVVGVSSGEILATQCAEETGATTITVVGDARRQRFWMATFVAEADGLRMQAPYCLVRPEELGALPAEGVVVTPHWASIGNALQECVPPSVLLMPDARCPSAAVLAVLALRRMETAAFAEVLLPIYLHPPVFVPPRFP